MSKKGVTPDETLVRFPRTYGRDEAEGAGGCRAECAGSCPSFGVFTPAGCYGSETAWSHGEWAARGYAAVYPEKGGVEYILYFLRITPFLWVDPGKHILETFGWRLLYADITR